MIIAIYLSKSEFTRNYSSLPELIGVRSGAVISYYPLNHSSNIIALFLSYQYQFGITTNRIKTIIWM